MRQLHRWTERDIPDYTMYSDIATGYSPVGVMMFVRNDMTARATRIQVDPELEETTT